MCDIDKIWHLDIFWDFIDNDNQMIFCYDLHCVALQACRGPLTPKVYEFLHILCGAQFTAVTEINLFQQVYNYFLPLMDIFTFIKPFFVSQHIVCQILTFNQRQLQL